MRATDRRCPVCGQAPGQSCLDLEEMGWGRANVGRRVVFRTAPHSERTGKPGRERTRKLVEARRG